MRFRFYCTPEELRAVFSAAEKIQPMEYSWLGQNLTYLPALDDLLRQPLYSCQDIHDFGRYSLWPRHLLVYPSPGDDSERGCAFPIILDYSGPPGEITGRLALCEGSLVLESEYKFEKDQALFRTLRSCFQKQFHFKKAGHGWLSPSVWEHRWDYLFFCGTFGMAAGPWRLDERDQVAPLNCLVPEDKALLERLPRLPDDQRKFSFFAETEDFQELFHQLSKEYGSLLYLEHPSSQTTPLNDPEQLLSLGPGRRQIKRLVLYDYSTRTFVNLFNPGGCWNGSNRIIDVTQVNHVQSLYGNTLYLSLVEAVKARFHPIAEPHYGPFYLSPKLYQRRHELILNLNDPRFRIDGEDRPIHVWRKEWDELLGTWNLADESLAT